MAVGRSYYLFLQTQRELFFKVTHYKNKIGVAAPVGYECQLNLTCLKYAPRASVNATMLSSLAKIEEFNRILKI